MLTSDRAGLRQLLRCCCSEHSPFLPGEMADSCAVIVGSSRLSKRPEQTRSPWGLNHAVSSFELGDIKARNGMSKYIGSF